MKDGFKKACKAVDSGAALRNLQKLKKITVGF
jgi:anthranilate phosphoribosyltransferase